MSGAHRLQLTAGWFSCRSWLSARTVGGTKRGAALEAHGSTLNQAWRYNLIMRITKGKVVDGQIVVEGESLTEGSVVTVLVSDERTFTLNPEDEVALLEAIAEADRGDLVDAETFLSGFRRIRDVASQSH